MRKDNKKLKLLVRVLLVTIGVSFAFFISRVLLDGIGGSSKGTTAIIDGAKLTLEGNLEFTDLDILPGHKNVSSLKITATGENEFVPYKVIWEGTNTLNTPLNFYVYKITENLSVSATCEKKNAIQDGAQILNEECTISNIESLGEVLSSGTINTSTSLSKVTLIDKEAITAISAGEIVYYYVVLEYPNLQEAQNSDIGGSFTGKVRVESTESLADITIAKVYIPDENGEYQETSDVPKETDGYILNETESTCTNNATPSWNSEDWSLNVSSLSVTGTSCNLYFDEVLLAKNTILANKTISERTDFSTTLTSNTTGTVYIAEDNDGTSYYFAGAPTDNYVKFAGYYWRIIRINGDESIRMIYDGTVARENGASTSIAYVTTSAFNTLYNNNAYVGYMYNSGVLHGIKNSSTVKNAVDNWYKNNLLYYSDYIDIEAGFCGDRITYSGTGTGTDVTYYAAYNRLDTNKNPILKCNNAKDLYTISESTKGNQALTYPVGLITADEAAYAGATLNNSNKKYYLFTGDETSAYWTMTPSNFNSNIIAWTFFVNDSLNNGYYVHNDWVEVRPVINLRADVNLKGNGTTTSPYEIVLD